MAKVYLEWEDTRKFTTNHPDEHDVLVDVPDSLWEAYLAAEEASDKLHTAIYELYFKPVEQALEKKHEQSE